jgi:hypothetical protein
MSDFYAPALIPRSAFEELIARVDRAVGEHSIALVLHEYFPFRALDPISPTSIDFSGIQIKDPSEVVDNLDQLLYFAFERAPREVIADWAIEQSEELVDEAVDRVLYIRKNMPELSELWSEKSDSLVPPLVGFEYETARSRGEDDLHVNMYLSAARISRGGLPDRTDMVRLRVQLWPSDIRLLIRELEHLWAAHLSESANHVGGEIDDGAAETDS